MFQKILPPTIDNNFRGNKIALYFFYLFTVMTVVRSCIHIFKYDGGAQSIATYPLDTFTENGAAVVILIFAQWGLSQLLMSFLYVIVALRYKSLIPLMYVFLILEYAGRFAISFIKTAETIGTPPGRIGNYIYVPLCLGLLLLSIYRKN